MLASLLAEVDGKGRVFRDLVGASEASCVCGKRVGLKFE